MGEVDHVCAPDNGELDNGGRELMWRRKMEGGLSIGKLGAVASLVGSSVVVVSMAAAFFVKCLNFDVQRSKPAAASAAELNMGGELDTCNLCRTAYVIRTNTLSSADIVLTSTCHPNLKSKPTSAGAAVVQTSVALNFCQGLKSQPWGTSEIPQRSSREQYDFSITVR